MLLLSFCLVSIFVVAQSSIAFREYTCEANGKCELHKTTQHNPLGMSQETCLMICDQGIIWPYPTGTVDIKQMISTFDLQTIEFEVKENINQIPPVLNKYWENFYNVISNKQRPMKRQSTRKPEKTVSITMNIRDVVNTTMTLGLDESYSIVINEMNDSNQVTVTITSNTIFGARHSLETLSQLISWDMNMESYVIASNVQILNDSPQFTYRGVMVDISRQFISIHKLQLIIQAMVSI